MAAAYLMGEVCQRMIKPGNKNTQVTEALSKICKAYDVNMLQGILMHQMKRFVIDGNKVILTCNHETDRVDECTFEPNEVYQVDIALTKGDGKTRAVGTRTTVFRRNVEETYLLKMKAARSVISEIDTRFPVFPFSSRYVLRKDVRNRALDDKTARMGIMECVNHNLLEEYPVIYTRDGSVAVHYKFTVLLVPNGTDRITGNMIDMAAYPSEKKCEDEEILNVMKYAAIRKSRKSKKNAKKAAQA